MGAHFQGHRAPPHSRKLLPHGFAARRHAAFRHHLAVVPDHAVAAGLVSQVHADRDRPFAPGCRPFRTLGSGAILFHGRSPFALRVRIHWELIASRRGSALSFHLSIASITSASALTLSPFTFKAV